MKQKINIRLALIALIAVAFTALGTILVCYHQFQMQVQNDLRLNARLLMETEVFQKVYANSDSTLSGIDITALNRLETSDMLRITWIDENGTVLFDNDADAGVLENHLDRPEIQEALIEGAGESTRRSETMGLNTFNYALLLEDGTVLRVSAQARSIISVFLAVLPVILSIAAAIVVICTVIGHFLTGQLLRPIEQMAENIEDPNCVTAYKELEPFADKIRNQHENVLAAAKSRQDFTANISHELKTPITAISGYAELIENGLVSGKDEAHAARQIRHNAERLLSLITDIIQLSELDHKELKRTFETVDLRQIARESVRDLQPLAEQRGVSLSCKGSSAGIYADRQLIREMLDNLIQNAIRYNKEHGSADVLVTIENSHPVISVKDTGIGIPADQQSRVFERFYRVDKSRSRATGGTGLGLAIVKHIADIHSAEISLVSELGKGTEITVRF